MNLSEINYQEMLDWGHCEEIKEAIKKFSEITRVMNQLTMVTKEAEMELLLKIADWGEMIPDKLSRDNKLVKLIDLEPAAKDLFIIYKRGKSGLSQVRSKREAILEDLMALKKIESTQQRYA
jgi:uncharacterized protein YecA (UPF0149 family)